MCSSQAVDGDIISRKFAESPIYQPTYGADYGCGDCSYFRQQVQEPVIGPPDTSSSSYY